MTEHFLKDRVALHCGDCREVLAILPECSLDACVTDPPYHLTSIVKRFGADDAAPVRVSRPYGGRFKEENGGTGAAFARMSRGFMGKVWDGGDIAFQPDTWRAVLRVLKPGAHALVFCIPKHIGFVQVAMQEAGFEFRDVVVWAFGSGFPKSHDVSKGIDRAAGAEREVVGIHHRHGGGNHANVPDSSDEAFNLCRLKPDSKIPLTAPATDAARQWEGWGSALKPSVELVVLARKPLAEKTIAANVLRWGTGALNIDGCRVGYESEGDRSVTIAGAQRMAKSVRMDPSSTNEGWNRPWMENGGLQKSLDVRAERQEKVSGRWPANLILDGSAEVVAAFPDAGGHNNGELLSSGAFGSNGIYGTAKGKQTASYADSGSAARFFYQVKQDDPCHSINSASDAVEHFAPQSEHVVSALSNAVAQSTLRWALHRPSYRGHVTNVSDRELKLTCASVIETIQNLERRSALALPRESVSVRLGPAMCVAIPNQIGTTTITISLSMFDHCAEVATFDIIETSEEVGERVYAKRFHYSSKADADDRLGSRHPTIKPLDLMQYLCRLVCRKGGTILDCFAGTGTTGEAAWREGMNAVLIERENEYQADIRRRMALALAGPDERTRESIKAKKLPRDDGPLFADRETWHEIWSRPFDYSKLGSRP